MENDASEASPLRGERDEARTGQTSWDRGHRRGGSDRDAGRGGRGQPPSADEIVRKWLTVQAVAPLSEQAQALALRLDQFDFSMRDQKAKSVGQHTHWFYLMDGKAKGPDHDPKAFHGWIDYDRGVWEEATLTYSWGKVDAKQKCTRLHNAWILTYQYLYSKQYDASLEAACSNFQFSP